MLIDVSECLFCNPVNVVYHHLNIDGSETSYSQSKMDCKQVADGLYLIKGDVSLFNPNTKGVFLLVVVKRDSVSFKNVSAERSYVGGSLALESFGVLQKFIDFGKKYKINGHAQKSGTVYLTCTVVELTLDGVVKFIKEGSDSVLCLNIYDFHFLRFRVC